jgi:hypothetical protein
MEKARDESRVGFVSLNSIVSPGIHDNCFVGFIFMDHKDSTLLSIVG